jgi:hypothetical protein
VRDDEAAAAPHVSDHPVELLLGGRARLDERLDAEVVVRLRLGEQLVDRTLWLELGLLSRCQHVVRLVLRRLDIRLVERVDLEIRTGHGDRELPAEELRSERVWIRQIGVGGLPAGSLGRLARRGDQSLPVLSRRLGDELLGPEPELAGTVRDADLVPEVPPALAEPTPELVAGIADARAAGLPHLLRTVEELARVGAHQHRRHDPERRERGIASPDRRFAGEDSAKAALAGEALELGARIRDRTEPVAPPAGLLPEVVGVGARLERRAGFRGRDEERPLEVQLGLERADRPRMRRVEDVKPVDAERPAQHLGRERGAAHPAQDDVVDLVVQRLREAADVTELLGDVQGLVEPAEPLRLVASGPRRGIPLPDAFDQPLGVHRYAATASRFALTPSRSSANESENFCTPSFSSVSTTSS